MIWTKIRNHKKFTTTWSLILISLLFSLITTSCATSTQIRDEIQIIDERIEKARKQNAMKLNCGPKDLALAEANKEFAEIELSQGDWRQAKYHISKARKHVNAALILSKPCEIVDRDGDGILDQHDKCPDNPEDKDGFEDDDGCPEPDNDKDGICDPWISELGEQKAYIDICKGVDKCPTNPEDFNGYQDDDGCPEKDSDGDGIYDDQDKCPQDPEDFDGFEDEDGCPDPDNDKDGILDEFDKCPMISEDIDTFQDEDGCPDPDNDGDGILDINDKCPNDPEDFDGFEDEEGCPEPDNDQDGICDSWISEQNLLEKYKTVCKGIDKCPNEPETVNSYMDEDGCPDEEPKKYTLIEVKEDKIELKQKVFFAFGKAKIDKKSFDMLDQIVDALLSRKNVKVVIEGHTDNKGSAKINKKLSQQRADAVRDYLANKGVDESRLESVGYGMEKPIASNKTEKGREMNRRVEFNIKKD